MRIALVMAGGGGSRLWPASTPARPKQFMALSGERGQSLLGAAIGRAAAVADLAHTFVVTTAELAPSVRAVGPGLAPDNLIEEPRTRSTAPCVALSLLHVVERLRRLGCTEGQIDAAPIAVPTAAGLPATLRESLVDVPQLPTEIVTVSAAPTANSMFAYPIGFKCTLPDNKHQLAGAALYVHGDELVIVPDFDRLSGGLLSRTRESVVRVTVPAGALRPGQYHVTLVGARSSRAWTLQVH